MDEDTYCSILERLGSVPLTALPWFKAIASAHGVQRDTVYSIYSQEVQHRVMKTHRSLCDVSADLMKKYLTGEAKILDLCVEWGLPPCTMLRRLLECCPGLGCKSSKSIGSVFKDASVLRSCISPNVFKEIEVEWGIDMYKLHGNEEEFLQCIETDVRESVLVDGICGPSSDAARQHAGQEYEHKLYDCLKEHNVSFWTEDELRGQNFYKTPDALLRVPIAVHDKVICWIDSKATFCDVRSHRKLLEDQYNSYVNRFGPGLVIYWHGYLEAVATISRDFLTVTDSFPRAEDITRLPCL